MIKLKSIALTNFMNIEQLNLSFESKTNIMIGGENGEGKSALIDAIALALVDYKKGDSYRDYVRRGCEEASVRLEAILKGYPIEYTIKISNRTYGSPTEKNITYRDKTYQNSECKILMDSLNIEYLEHTMFLHQNTNSVTESKPSERAKLLKKLFNFELDDYINKLKIDLEREVQQLNEAEIIKKELDNQSFEHIDLLKEASDFKLDSLRETLLYKKKEYKDLTYLTPFYIESLEKELKEREVSYINNKNWCDRLSSEKNDIEKETQILQDKIKNNIETLEALLLNDDETVLLDEENHSNQLSNLYNKKETLLQEILLLNNTTNVLEDQLKISKTGVCHACGHDIDEEHILELQQKLEEKKEALLCAKSTLEVLEDDIEKLTAKLNSSIKYRTCINENSQYEISIKENKKKLEIKISELHNHELILQRAKERLDEYKEKSAESNLGNLYEMYEYKLGLESQIEQLEKDIEEALRIQNINSERELMNQSITINKEKHEERLREISDRINTQSINSSVTKTALTIFEKDFPNFIILKTCSKLETYINKFIEKVFPYMKIKLKPSRAGVEFYYISKSSDEEWLSVKMASGAQKAILALAWNVAIAKVYGVDTIILDEADASATEKTAKIIYQFISELDTFDQLIFISHKKQAMSELISLMDNLVCYEVSNGEYNSVS